MVIHFNDGTRKNRYWMRSMSMYKPAGALGLKIVKQIDAVRQSA